MATEQTSTRHDVRVRIVADEGIHWSEIEALVRVQMEGDLGPGVRVERIDHMEEDFYFTTKEEEQDGSDGQASDTTGA